MTRRVRPRRRHDHGHGELRRQIGRLIRIAAAFAANDLLQADDVRVQLGDHARDAIQIAPSVAADSAVDVIARDGEQERTSPGRR